MGDYKLYSRLSDKETVLECWGASTKHPDSMFYFSDFEKCSWIPAEEQVAPWILECGSKMSLPYHAMSLGLFALELYRMGSMLEEVM